MVLLDEDLCLTGPPDKTCLLTGPCVAGGPRGLLEAGLHRAPSARQACGLCLKKSCRAVIAQFLFSTIILTVLEVFQCSMSPWEGHGRSMCKWLQGLV